MFLARIDRFARLVSFGSFRSSHANGRILAVGDAGSVVSHDSPICECPSLVECRLLHNTHFSCIGRAGLEGCARSFLVRCSFETVEFNRHNQLLIVIVARLFARGISYDGAG